MSNTSIETIKVNGVDYVRADSVTKPVRDIGPCRDSVTKPVRDIGPCRIIVADRGWVFVGNCEDNADGSVTIRNARNIRQWGTTMGLGQLVNGPLSGTKHDDYGEVRCTPVVQINVVKGW